MTRSVRLLGVTSAFVLVTGCETARAPDRGAAERPNVLFVFYDQFRPDIMGAYGGGDNIETPSLDRLAREGLRFEGALSTTPVCTPYRGMVMTGRYPTHTGILLNFLEAPTGGPTLAGHFAEAGYRTAFFGKWHLAAGGFKKAWVGQEQGSWEHARPYMTENPDYDFVPPGPARLGFEEWGAYNFHVDFLAAPYYRDAPEKLVLDAYESDGLTSLAIESMQQAQAEERPFFVMLAPHPPHPPFDRLPDGYLEQVPDTLSWDDNVPASMRAGENLSDARAYFAMAKNADDNVGRLLEFLDESGLAENTIVLFTSDHGEMLGSHGRRDKMVPYREAVQVPLVVRWPGKIRPGSTDALQTPLDHFPTLISLAELEPADGLDGVDLAPLLLEGRAPERDAVLMANYSAHWDYFKTASQEGARWPEWRGIKTKRYTYARYLDGSTLLFDDSDDPGQLIDLSGSPGHADVRAELEARLEALLAKAHDAFLPGNAYVDWVDLERNIIRTGTGPVAER